jgi:transposase
MELSTRQYRLVPEGFELSHLSVSSDQVAVHVRANRPRARCPCCGQFSSRVHSKYSRTVSDLPWRGVTVVLKVRARKFFCGDPGCERSIFCERLPEVVARARKTSRLEAALLAIVFELGGRAGARLAAELGLIVGRDALLSRAKNLAPEGGSEIVRVLGVDDFAFRKGNAYGTILVDLERHKVVELLPERSAEPLEEWLRGHPSGEVVTRDRSFVYARGIAAGVPDAEQVADRRHLLHGLALALEDYLLRKRPTLRKAAEPEAKPPKPILEADGRDDDVAAPGPMSPSRPRLWYARQEEAAKKRNERLVAQWREIRRLYLVGMETREISRTLGVSVRSVYRYKDLEGPPPRPAYKRRASVLDPYVPYLVRRWNEGCNNGGRLYREIREQGYSHCRTNVDRLLAEFRRASARGKPVSSVPRARKGEVAGSFPSAKDVAALFMCREERLTAEQGDYLKRLCTIDPALAEARRLTQEFARMARNLAGADLDGWLREAETSEAPVMRRFAAGLEKDLAAVRAGLTEEWSNGPVEGFSSTRWDEKPVDQDLRRAYSGVRR